MQPEFVDVSDNNGLHLDWNAVWASGVRGAICKVVQGDGSMHPGFLNNWFSIGMALLDGRAERRGAYNFCTSSSSPQANADKAYNLVNAAGGFTHQDDFLVMDLETGGIDANWAYAALSEASMRLGRRAWLYCSYGFLTGPLRRDSRLSGFPLWIADINASLPPLPWPHALWQYTWAAQVPGIPSRVDGSRRGPGYQATLAPPPKPVPPPSPPRQGPTIDDGDNVLSVEINGIHLDSGGDGEVTVKDVPESRLRGAPLVSGGSDPLHVHRYDKTPVTRSIPDSNPARIVITGGEPGGTYTLRVSHV